MFKNFFKKLTATLAISLTLICLAPAGPAHALFEGAVDQACQGTQLEATTTTKCDDGKAANTVADTLEVVLNVFSFIVGVIAIIMLIIGGLKYITSGGDSAGVNSAKNTIMYAVIGLVIVAISQSIVQFVITKTTT